MVGITYGPSFRNITQLSRSGDSCRSIIRIPDTRATMPCHFEFDHVIHPATLDAMLQTVFAVGDDEAMLPTSISSIFVAGDLPRGAGKTFRGFASARKVSPRQATAEVVMFDDKLRKPAVIIKGLTFRSLSGSTDGVGFLPTHRNLCSEMVWKKDVDLVAIPDVEALLDTMAHKNPALSALQIGGMPTEAAAWVVNILGGGHDTPRFSQYTMCDVSKDAYSAVQSQFKKPCANRIDHKSKEEEVQSKRQHDLLVFDAHLVDGLEVFSKMLKPGGRAIVRTQGIPSHAGREAIRTVLQAVGLELSDLPTSFSPELSCFTAGCGPMGVVTEIEHSSAILLLPDEMSPSLAILVENTCHALDGLGVVAFDIRQAAIASLREKDFLQPCISFLEAESPVLYSMGKDQFPAIHRFLHATKSLLWLTRGAQMEVAEPRSSAFVGLARTLRSEDARKKIVSLDIDVNEALQSDTTAEALASVFGASFSKNSPNPAEAEFVLREGNLLIPRLMLLPTLNSIIEGGTSRPQKVQQVVVKNRPVKLGPATVGGAMSPLFVDDPEAQRPLGPTELRIAVSQTQLQLQDVDAVTGEGYSDVGADVSGNVLEVGSGIQDIRVSDSVVALVQGSIRTRVCVDVKYVRKCGREVETADHHSPSALATALYGLRTIARVSQGDTILILGAASMCGQAAIQVANKYKADIFVGCSNEKQREVLLQIPSVARDRVLNTSDAGFVQKLRQLTSGEGVDVVFNPTPNNVAEAFECVRECKCLVQAATQDCIR